VCSANRAPVPGATRPETATWVAANRAAVLPGSINAPGSGPLWQTVGVAVGTLYDLLDVAPTAGTEEIRSAYRKLSKIYHPDLGGTAAFFRQLQEGYETLTDPIRRAAYDRSLANHRLLREAAMGSPARQQASSQRADNPSAGHVSTRKRRYVRLPYNFGQPSGPGSSSPFGDVAPNYRRLLDSWTRGVDSLAVTSRARRRHDIVSATWISSVIVAGVVVGTLLEATHGFVLLLLLIMAVIAWRRHKSTKRKAERRERAAQAAAELNRSAREAAERRRISYAAHAAATQRGRTSNATAATRERPAHARSTDPLHATVGPEGEWDRRRAATAAARSGDLDGIARSSPKQFEYTMVALLGMLGKTDVYRVGERGEQAVDFAARDGGGRPTIVRCSRDATTKVMGAEDLRQLVDTEGVDHQAELELLITMSNFTSDARDLARRRGIQLLDGVAVEQLARRWRESHR
jgi:curved DNA-binding protein CbpA